MTRTTFLLLALLAAATVVGLRRGHSEPPVTPVATPRATPAESEPTLLPWQEKFGLPESVVPAEISFETDDLRDMFLRADSAARMMSKDWDVRANDIYAYRYWNGGSDGYTQCYGGSWKRTSKDVTQSVSIATDLFHRSYSARGFHMDANYSSPDEWQSRLSFRCGMVSSERVMRIFDLCFSHPKWTKQAKDPALRDYGLFLSPGRSQIHLRMRQDNYTVEYYLRSRGPGYGPAGDEFISRYWKSAVSFREICLEELDLLEKDSRATTATGGGVLTLGGDGGHPPEPAPGVAVKDEVRAKALEEALARIAERRQLIEAHYVELHRVATATFPSLLEVLSTEEASLRAEGVKDVPTPK